MKIQFIIFFLIFLLIYTGLNSYVILRLGGLLGVGRRILYIFIAIITISLPFSVYLERVFPNILSKIFYMLSTLWLGVLLFMISLLFIYEIIRRFYSIPHAGIIIATLVILLSITSIINASGLSVREIELPIENLEKEISIVHLSDIHLGTIRNSAYLKKIIQKTDDIDPDIVMITGDMVDAVARLHEGMFDDFNTLDAPVYFVSGNHELMEGIDEVYALFKDTNIRVLKNELVIYDGIQIVGIEYFEGKNYLADELKKIDIDRTKPSVLMYHTPTGIGSSKEGGIDLQLSGHTHNGQIVPFNLLVKTVFRHIKGLYDLEDMYLYVSPGTGTWGPYMRLGSRNEITHIKLVAK